ncbi:MAG: hypothetical protein Q8K66_04165 [Sediminibacterium sp.]|nr:hypothetical protein [Sediminibacterium sp.]MDP3128134.1 hypothetical protein [Sediminibacterium sp.]
MPKPQTITIEVTITEHAFNRAKERLGLNQQAFKKIAVKAYISGKAHDKAKGQLRDYISELYLRYKNANNIRIYGEVVYLFCNSVLITLYHLPNDLKKYTKF